MRPIQHLNAAGGMYPEAWKQVEEFRIDRGRGLPDWPSWCLLPMAAWYAIVSEGGNMSLNRVPDVGRLAAIGTWRYSHGIYRFDESVYEALRETVPSGEMPLEVLFRLPEWCVYIETPGSDWFGDPMYGFWAHIEFDINKKLPELRLLLDTEQMLLPMPLHMGKWTVTEAVDRALSETAKQARIVGFQLPTTPAPSDLLAAKLHGLVSLVLYLCSDEPEIDDERTPGSFPQRPQPTRIKGASRLFPAKRPRVWNVGTGLGEKLRQSPPDLSNEILRHTKSPHLRKAHWHGFWSGPMTGERRFNYKWLPPIAVVGQTK